MTVALMAAGSRGGRRLAALALALWLAGCAPGGPDLRDVRGGRGGTLRLAAANDVRTLDNAIGYDTASWRFERLIYDGLLNYDERDATLVPAIARALPTVRDGRVFTFHLRDDVYFHHGRRVVAGDFRYALERVLDPRNTSPAISLYEHILGAKEFTAGRARVVTGLRCPDDFTFEVELTKPDLAFLNVISMPFAYAVPREVVERYSLDDWPRHAVGAGPYRLAAWEPGRRLRVERFDRFYNGRRGRLGVVEQQFGIPEFMQLMMFERGQLDVTDIPLPDFERVKASPRLAPCLRSMAENAIAYCSMNCELPPFDNKQLRQAFNYAVDKQQIAKVLAGTAQVATGVLPPGMPGYDPALRGYPHDPARARALLAEAGFAQGLEVELTTRSRPAEQRWAEVIQQNLEAVGVRCRMRAVAFPQWLDLSGKRRGLPFTINAWFQDYPDPSNFLDILLHGGKITETNSNNRAFYNNQSVNRLLDRAASMTDYEARLALYREAERLVVDDAPWIFVYYPTRYVLVQPWVHGYRLHPVWSSREDLVWLGPPGKDATP
jgi:ABC-type transport system substrate-binding protein